MSQINISSDSSERQHFSNRSRLFLCEFILTCLIWTATAVEVWSCDIVQAETCVVQLKDHIKAISQSIQNLNNIDKTDIGILCTQSVLGSNFNECYLNATSNCPQISWKLESAWELAQNDVFKLCEKVCPGFVVRTTNVSRCTYEMRKDPTLMTNFDMFCNAMNTTLQCALNEADGCAFYTDILRSLLPKDAETFAVSVCREECKTIDMSLDKLTHCQKHMDSILATMDCTSIGTFKQCLIDSGVPGCPILESVVNATYPYHIYGPLEIMCNGSEVSYPTPDAECQQVMPHGHTEIRNCMETVLHSAHHFKSMKQKQIQKDDCLQYDAARECVDKSGASKCQLLTSYLHQMEDSHSDYFNHLRYQCPYLNSTFQETTDDVSTSPMTLIEGSSWSILILLMTSLYHLVIVC